jgi:hypothetical protein
VPRVGLEHIREVVARDGPALIERFRIAKAAVRDPWLERDEPYHPRQFQELGGDRALSVIGPPAEDQP